jgi:hypothetical protein
VGFTPTKVRGIAKPLLSPVYLICVPGLSARSRFASQAGESKALLPRRPGDKLDPVRGTIPTLGHRAPAKPDKRDGTCV